eukprot:3889525-Alexandrium_andersonii.AAC.1
MTASCCPPTVCPRCLIRASALDGGASNSRPRRAREGASAKLLEGRVPTMGSGVRRDARMVRAPRGAAASRERLRLERLVQRAPTGSAVRALARCAGK